VCEGDSVAFRVTIAATHTGVFAGRAPTGRRVTWAAADFAEMRGGKIAELWSVQDARPLLQGVGTLTAFPSFVKNRANLIARASQLTEAIEGYVFDGADGGQVALWTCTEDRVSKPHEHPFDEYVLVVEGRCTAVVEGKRIALSGGDELVIPKGTRQTMEVSAGTRTIHVFGGKRAKRADEA
jgi:quercetin dioxygenase-like cupin family protein